MSLKDIVKSIIEKSISFSNLFNREMKSLKNHEKPYGFEMAVHLLYSMVKSMNRENREYLINQKTPQLFATCLHHNIGRTMRNNWGLWEDKNQLRNHMYKRFGIDHPDDISSVISMCTWQKLNNKPMTPSIFADSCIKYWDTLNNNNGKSLRVIVEDSGVIKVEPTENNE